MKKKIKLLVIACLALCCAFIATGCASTVIIDRYLKVDDKELGYRLMGDGTFYLYNDGDSSLDWDDYELEDVNDIIINRPWNDRLDDIKKVIIKDKITHIGTYSFYNITKLTEVVIGPDVETIGANAFKNCSNLTKITLDENNTNFVLEDGCLVHVATGNLIRANNKAEITVPSIVKTMEDGAFHGLTGLKKLDMSQSQLVEIKENACSGCSSLEQLQLPATVKTIDDYAFFGCSSLKDVDFKSCVNLKKIGFSSFYGCSSIKNIEFAPAIGFIGMTAFRRCGVEKVVIPETVGRLSLGSSAFYECPALKEVYIHSMDTISSVKMSAGGGYLFANEYQGEKGLVTRNLKIYIEAAKFDVEKLGSYIANGENYVRQSENETVDGVEYVVYKGAVKSV